MKLEDAPTSSTTTSCASVTPGLEICEGVRAPQRKITQTLRKNTKMGSKYASGEELGR